ncbi:MAG TPA: RNA helicase, partial [Mycobacteriales bacterium]
GLPPRVPAGAARDALEQTIRLWSAINDDERAHQLTVTAEPDLGFAWPAYRWTRGESLDRVLTAAGTAGQELSAGDFVRWCKQVLDLLEQISEIAEQPLRSTARAASAGMRRGVVAYTSVR